MRILGDVEIKVDKVKGWINRRGDPEFWDRAQDLCGLDLSPPENAMVLSSVNDSALKDRACRRRGEQNVWSACAGSVFLRARPLGPRGARLHSRVWPVDRKDKKVLR